MEVWQAANQLVLIFRELSSLSSLAVFRLILSVSMRDTFITAEEWWLNNVWDNANKTLPLIRTNVPDEEPPDVPALENYVWQ